MGVEQTSKPAEEILVRSLQNQLGVFCTTELKMLDTGKVGVPKSHCQITSVIQLFAVLRQNDIDKGLPGQGELLVAAGSRSDSAQLCLEQWVPPEPASHQHFLPPLFSNLGRVVFSHTTTFGCSSQH